MIALLTAGPARAGLEFPDFAAEVKTYSCRELMGLDESRQNIALIYLIGYLDGQRNVERYESRLKATAAIRVLEHCRTDAATSVLEVLRSATPLTP